MKKYIISLISLLVCVSVFAAWVDIPENSSRELFEHNSFGERTTGLQFFLNGYELNGISENNENYQKVSYPDESNFIEVGKPDLPRFTRIIAVPNQGVVSYEISFIEDEYIPNITIYPKQPLKIDGQPNIYKFTKNEDFYSGNEIFPAQIVEITEPAILRNIRIVTVSINPFQYNPETKEIRIIKNIDIVINVEEQGGGNTKSQDRKISRAYEPLYRSMILNYDEFILGRDITYQDPSYLFIYPTVAQVETNLQYLVDWKHQKGFDVNTQGFTSGTSSSTIKNYIQTAYDTWENPPEFVCLVGDAGGSYNIPTGYYSGPGDHYYTLLEGNDILADVFIGRLSFNSITEFQTIIAKILNYEKEPYMDQTNWYQKALLVGDPSSSEQSCIITNKYIKEIIEANAPYYNYTEVYSSPFDSQMNNAINNGVSYFNYRGYIGMSGWGISDIGNLSNGYMLPVMVFLTCSTGNFEGTSNCRSEYALKVGSPTDPKGAIAAIGTATSSTHTCFNNCVSAGTYCGIFLDEIYNMGGALTRGKVGLYLNYPQNPYNWVEKKSYWNNLMGDPGMEVWTGIPEAMNVVYDAEISIGTNYLEVTVENSSGVTLENAWVTILMGDDDIFETGYSDSDGKIVFPIGAESAGTVDLTVTKHNFIPHLGSFDIVQSDVFVNAIQVQIDDDTSGTSSGNGDGYINPGEDIELNVKLKNFGLLTANSVTATISSESDLITISDNIEDYGNISAGNSAFSSDDFDISISPTALGGAEIRLNIHIEDGNGNDWNDFIYLMVTGANLYVDSYTIVNDPNGILDPGETVELVVTIHNGGTVAANAVDGLLMSTSPNITMVDSIGFFNNVNPGGQASNSGNNFQINANLQTLPGSQIPLKLLLTNSDGYENEVTFILEVGEVEVTDPLGPDGYGYYCYDSEDTEYDMAPVYSWVEIDPTYGGPGTTMSMYDPGDTGDIEIISMPFNFNFYGINYNSITVCSNGWISPGVTEQYSFMNWHLPDLLGPSPMIAPFWDDLKTSSGHVCYYHDTASNLFIVEWSHLQNDFNSAEETFQVIIFDPDHYPTCSGDAEFVFQYETINNVDQGDYYSYHIQHGQYATVGLEDHTGLIGLEYTFNNSYPTAARQLQNGLALKFTTEGGMLQNPAQAVINPDSFQFALLENSTDSSILEISNIGEANLVYNISKEYVEGEDGRSRGQGGPDNYGYVWIDSNEPDGPEYDWRDITGLGTQVTFTHNDIGTSLMPIGFDFLYYGTLYTQFRINPNGWIGFGDDNQEWNNLSLPHPDAPRPAIIPFWDDLDPLQSGDVYYYSTSDSLVIWFDDVIHFPGTYNGTYDFQLILYSNDNFLIQYRTMVGTIDSATIGIQDENNSDFLQIVYNGNYVENQLAVSFSRIINWLDVYPQFGYIPSGETENITLNVSSEDLYLGDYLCNLTVTTNDPENYSVTIPVNLSVVTDLPIIDLSQNSFDFGSVLIDEEVTDTLTVTNTGSNTLEVYDITNENIDYSVNITNFNLEPGESQDVLIAFVPSIVGAILDTLSISSNAAANPVVYVSLEGEGYEQTDPDDILIPKITEVKQNYPNPFNPETTISFSVADKLSNVKIEVFNIKGQKVKTLVEKKLQPGYYSVVWNGKNETGKSVSSGVYFYKFKAGKYLNVKKMLMIK
ncbi:MAG: DUF1573 domain-containing protein [Candidatus Cloacimonetes bacterium]|nr:DUF1573 domain-containing protein [Candidatus Cloacimonadota bacterium]